MMSNYNRHNALRVGYPYHQPSRPVLVRTSRNPGALFILLVLSAVSVFAFIGVLLWPKAVVEVCQLSIADRLNICKPQDVPPIQLATFLKTQQKFTPVSSFVYENRSLPLQISLTTGDAVLLGAGIGYYNNIEVARKLETGFKRCRVNLETTEATLRLSFEELRLLSRNFGRVDENLRSTISNMLVWSRWMWLTGYHRTGDSPQTRETLKELHKSVEFSLRLIPRVRNATAAAVSNLEILRATLTQIKEDAEAGQRYVEKGLSDRNKSTNGRYREPRTLMNLYGLWPSDPVSIYDLKRLQRKLENIIPYAAVLLEELPLNPLLAARDALHVIEGSLLSFQPDGIDKNNTEWDGETELQIYKAASFWTAETAKLAKLFQGQTDRGYSDSLAELPLQKHLRSALPHPLY